MICRIADWPEAGIGWRSSIPFIVICRLNGIKKLLIIQTGYCPCLLPVFDKGFHSLQKCRISGILFFLDQSIFIGIKLCIVYRSLRSVLIQRICAMQNPRINPVYFLRKHCICLRLFCKIAVISLAILPDDLTLLVPVQILKIGFQINLKPEVFHCRFFVILPNPVILLYIRIGAGIAIGCFLNRLADPDSLTNAPLFHRKRLRLRSASGFSGSILPYAVLSRIGQGDPFYKTVFFTLNPCSVIKACSDTGLPDCQII